MQEEKACCCPKGSWPALTVDYKAKGQYLDAAGTKAYHVGSSDRVLVIIEDIFGATSARHESVADTFADFGYNVYLPHILPNPYTGDVGSPEIVQNIKSQNWETVESRFKAFVNYLNENDIKEFFVAGFCWGVWAAFKLSLVNQGFKAIVGFHPSFPICGMFGENEQQLIESVSCPAFFLPASNDPANIKEGGEWVTILENKFGADKVATKTFPEQMHGFVVRGDVSQPDVHRDVEESLRLAKEYLAKF